MKVLLSSMLAIAIVGTAVTVEAKKPNPNTGVGIDLSAEKIVFKTQCKGEDVCKVNNFSLTVANLGAEDIKNTRVEFYLSDDDILTTLTDEITTVADTLIHTQSLGAMKAGKTKKRTVGGGLLKKLAPQAGQYVIGVVDANYDIEELDEINNIIISDPLK